MEATRQPAKPPEAIPPPLEHPPEVRMIAIDLDGTLLTDAKQVSIKTARALCGLPERGVKVVIASARPPRSVRPVYQALNLDTWQINYNGALIWDERAGRAIYHRPMGPLTVEQIIDTARDMFEEVLVSCEILDRWYTDRHDPSLTTETGKLFKPDVIAPLAEFCDRPITKLLLLAPSYIINRIEPLLTQAFQEVVTFVRTDDHMLQVMDRRVSKAVALQKVAREYGVPMAQVMAIGDAPNDVGMLKAAGIGVAMNNAHTVVKKVANWIAPSNNDHGVHAALVRYGLCER